MLHKIYDWFGLHTLDTITASLNKTVDRLHAHADKLYSQAVDDQVASAKLAKSAQEKGESAVKAKAIAGKIGALIS